MTERIREALRQRYRRPEYLLLEEVKNATGFVGRSADALALGLWPSNHMWLRGFEIKVNRADLLSELRNPLKWRGVGRYCDHWWLVTVPGVWKKTDDIPGAWGVMELDDTYGDLKVRRGSRRQETEPLDRAFIAALLRKAIPETPSKKSHSRNEL